MTAPLARALPLASVVLTIACGTTDSDSAPAGPESYPTPPAPAPLEWSPCTDQLAGVVCATMNVPLDYANPNADTIQIALSKIAAADPAERIGSLLVNPGGPGNPGRSTPGVVRDLFASKGLPLSRFDLIGFDPRGVGASTTFDCGDVQAIRTVDWTPDDDVERQDLEAAAREFAATCDANTGPVLGFLDSYSVARDIDQIRRALREEKISLFMVSYGTVMGTAYADLFPEHVRAMVLDSAVRPNLDGAEYARERLEALDQGFDAFASDCNARPECADRFGGDIRAAFDRAIAQVRATPLVDPTTGQSMNESTLTWDVADSVLKLPDSSASIESVIEKTLAGDGSWIPQELAWIQLEAEGATPFYCADLGLPAPAKVFAEVLPALTTASPLFGHFQLATLLPCSYWPDERRTHPPPHAAGAPPLLVIGSTGDPNLPYRWSETLAAELASGVLLTREGVGHSALHWNQCTFEAATAYLVDLVVPDEGTVCAGP